MKKLRLLKKQMVSFAALVAAKDTMLRIISSRYRKIEHRGSTQDPLTQVSATRRGHRAGTIKVAARGMTGRVVKEKARERGKVDTSAETMFPLPQRG